MIAFVHGRLFAAVLLILPASINSGGVAWAGEQKGGIEIAIAPFLPVKTLVQNYAPLRDFLQAKLKHPVDIISAPDYKTYYKRIEMREYPVIVTPANSAYLAWTDTGYVPLLRPLAYTRPVLVTDKYQGIRDLSDLRGKTVAMPDALAIVSMQGMQMLREAGLKPGHDVSVRNLQNHAAAVNHVIAGEVAAAVVSDRAILQMPAQVRDKIKIVRTWDKGAAPGIVYMGSPNLPPKKLEQIKQAILEFAQHTPEGRRLMTDMGYDGLAPVAAEELRALEPYGILLKQALAGNP